MVLTSHVCSLKQEHQWSIRSGSGGAPCAASPACNKSLFPWDSHSETNPKLELQQTNSTELGIPVSCVGDISETYEFCVAGVGPP